MQPALARISALLAAQRRRRAASAALRTLACLLALHLAVLAGLGWFSMRHPLAPGWLAAMSWSLVMYLALPVAAWLAWSSRRNSPEEVARELDRANPGAPDPFRTVLSLENHRPETLGALDGLYAQTLPRLALPRRFRLPLPHKAALAAAILALAAAAFLSGRPGEFLRRAALPWREAERLPILRFELGGPSLVVAAGDSIRVEGRVRNLHPGQAVYAYVRAAAGETRYPLAPDAEGNFGFTYGPAETDFSLAFAGDNGRSRSLAFRVVAPPYLSRVRAILHPPAYTRLRADTLPEGVTRFPVLPGTRVAWDAASDRPLRQSAWTFRPAAGDSAKAAPAQEDTLGPGSEFTLSREIRAATDYAWWLEDEEGIRSRAGAPFRIDLAPDLPPEVDWIVPAGDTVLERDARLGLTFRAKDDYGIASLKLAWKILSGGKARGEGQRDARDWLRGASAGMASAEWDLSKLGIRPGETVEFHLAATDNDTVNGPKAGRSAVRTLRLATLQEVLAQTRQREQNAEAGLRSALQREKQLERKLEREREAPREEGPPMLADYEMNRIMVDDPRDQSRRAESILGQLQQSLDKQASQASGGDKSQKAGRDLSQAQAAAKELQEHLRRGEPALPRGNQGMLPAEERRKNLENLMKNQKEQAEKLAALREKLAKTPPQKPGPDQSRLDLARLRLDEAAKELEKNMRNQADLGKLLKEQEAQAKAKSDMMDQAIQEQMRMAEDLKGANDDLQKAAEQGARNGLLSPELIEKMKKVQDLLREVLPDSVQKLMESKLRGQEVDEKELKERLKEMLEKQAEMAEQLTRALAMLEQMKDRKRMEELKRALGDLQAREEDLEKQMRAGQAGAEQDAEQKAVAQETQKALADFSAQAAERKALQDLDKQMRLAAVQKDMQDVRQALAAAKGKAGAEKQAAASAGAKSAGAAAEKLGGMAEMLGEAMAGMGESIDIGEANELLQETLALGRLQLTIRSGSARRQSDGWEGDEAALYGSVAQTSMWINERVKALAAKVPFLGNALNAQARGLAQSAREASRQYSWEASEKALKYNQNLSRELLKLIKMAQSSGGGGGSGSGSGGQGEGQGEGAAGGDLASALQGMSGKQMAINQATYQLLKAMMEGRQQGPGQSGGKSPGGKGKGSESGSGESGGEGEGEGKQGGANGQGEGGEGEGLGGMANRQGEMGEKLEGMAEGLGEEGGASQKLRGLAEEARRLEEELRMGRLTPEELKRRQERFQSRLLEASNAMQERGQSESRQAEASRGGVDAPQAPSRAQEEARLLQLLREARRGAKGLRLSEGQRKRLDEFYETLLTR